MGSIPGSERSSGVRNGNPFQYSCLENSMDREAWQATVHGGHKDSVTTQWLILSLHFHTHMHCTYIFIPILLTHIHICQVELVVKNMPANAGDMGLAPESARSPVVGNGYPFQYSCLENHMDRGAWQATVHGGHKELHTTQWLNNNNNNNNKAISTNVQIIL